MPMPSSVSEKKGESSVFSKGPHREERSKIRWLTAVGMQRTAHKGLNAAEMRYGAFPMAWLISPSRKSIALRIESCKLFLMGLFMVTYMSK